MGMNEVYKASIKVCHIWKEIYDAAENSKKNMKHINRFLCFQILNKQWRLILPCTFNTKDKTFLEMAIAKGHSAPADGGIEKMTKAISDKFESQYYCWVNKQYIGKYDICQKTKYSQ